jgi:hypothetical protein
MLKLLRYVLLAIVALLLVETVIGLASDATGGLEKAVLAAVGILLVLCARRVRRIGAPNPREA